MFTSCTRSIQLIDPLAPEAVPGDEGVFIGSETIEEPETALNRNCLFASDEDAVSIQIVAGAAGVVDAVLGDQRVVKLKRSCSGPEFFR